MPGRRRGAAQAIADARSASVALAVRIQRARQAEQVQVLARDAAEAIRIASVKPWWPRVLNPETPVQEGRSFRFSVAGEP